MKYLAVFFVLVVCVQNVVPDETLDFKELFRDGKKKNQTHLGVNSVTQEKELIFLIWSCAKWWNNLKRFFEVKIILYKTGYIGSLAGPSEARTRHFGGRWGQFNHSQSMSRVKIIIPGLAQVFPLYFWTPVKYRTLETLTSIMRFRLVSVCVWVPSFSTERKRLLVPKSFVPKDD